MARMANPGKAETLTLSVSTQTRIVLQRMAEAGVYGKTAAEVAIRILDSRAIQYLANENDQKVVDMGRNLKPE